MTSRGEAKLGYVPHFEVMTVDGPTCVVRRHLAAEKSRACPRHPAPA
jgi:hypothetical protein